MKTLKLLVIVLSFGITSCKKNNEPNLLLGKWKEIERFDGYANGGNFQWNIVPDQYSDTITFGENGFYLLQQSSGSNYIQCSGTYNVNIDSSINCNTNCGSSNLKKISILTSAMLIVDIQVREGKIREKYIKLK